MRTHSICLALTIAPFSPIASAQWVQTNGLFGEDVIALGVSGTDLVAGPSGNTVFGSTDNGRSWSPVNAQIPK